MKTVKVEVDQLLSPKPKVRYAIVTDKTAEEIHCICESNPNICIFVFVSDIRHRDELIQHFSWIPRWSETPHPYYIEYIDGKKFINKTIDFWKSRNADFEFEQIILG